MSVIRPIIRRTQEITSRFGPELSRINPLSLRIEFQSELGTNRNHSGSSCKEYSFNQRFKPGQLYVYGTWEPMLRTCLPGPDCLRTAPILIDPTSQQCNICRPKVGALRGFIRKNTLCLRYEHYCDDQS